MGNPAGTSVSRTWLISYSLIFIFLAAVLSQLHLPLPGDPNFGPTPVTIAAVLLPWPVGMIAGVVEGISVSLWPGSVFLALPAGIGDALMALFTAWLAKRWRRSYAIIVGQISRYLFTSGVVAVSIGILVATGVISPGLSPIGNLTTSAWQNIVIIWKTITYPAVTLSIAVNMAASLLLVWLFGDMIKKTLKTNKS